MVYICLERYLKNVIEKLHARTIGLYPIIQKLGSNAYLISFHQRCLLAYFSMWQRFLLSFIFVGTSFILVPRVPSFVLELLDAILNILDNEFVASHSDGYRCFLVYQKDHSTNDDTLDN